MFDRIDLHIGHAKTGTTSLQRSFAASAELLAANGVFYWTGRPTHMPLAKTFRRGGAADPESERLRAGFLKDAAASNVPRAFVSSEVLAQLPFDGKRELIAFMRGLAREVHVLLYVRHPVAMASSAAQQGLKKGKRLAVSLERPRVLPLRRIVGGWSRAVGRDNMTVRAYDRLQLVNGDIVDDVLGFLGLSGISSEITREQRNESLSHAAALMIDELLAATGGRLPRTSLEPFFLIGGPKFRLPADVLADVREASTPELAFLKRRFGLVLPDPEASESELSAFDADAVRSIAHILFALGYHADVLHRRSLWARLRNQSVWEDALAALAAGDASFGATGIARPHAAEIAADESDAPARRHRETTPADAPTATMAPPAGPIR